MNTVTLGYQILHKCICDKKKRTKTTAVWPCVHSSPWWSKCALHFYSAVIWLLGGYQGDTFPIPFALWGGEKLKGSGLITESFSDFTHTPLKTSMWFLSLKMCKLERVEIILRWLGWGNWSSFNSNQTTWKCSLCVVSCRRVPSQGIVKHLDSVCLEHVRDCMWTCENCAETRWWHFLSTYQAIAEHVMCISSKSLQPPVLLS